MTTKIKLLLATNLFLVFAIFATIFLQTNKIHSSNKNDNEMPSFALTDSANVDKLVFGKNILKRQVGTTWIINDSVLVDGFMIQQLLEMLQKIAIKRTLTEKSQAEMNNKLATSGIEIKIFAGNTLQKSFKIIGNQNETIAKLPNTEPFVLHIPAYKAVLHEILTLPEKDWRNRTILSTGWNSLQYLAIEYPQNPEQNFSIIFDSLLYKETNQIFYKMQGIKNLDSVMLFNYIKAYNNVRVTKYLENATLQDSLQKLVPYCKIKVADLNPRQNNILRLYPTANKMFCIAEKNNALVLMDIRHISGLLVSKKDFEK